MSSILARSSLAVVFFLQVYFYVSSNCVGRCLCLRHTNRGPGPSRLNLAGLRRLLALPEILVLLRKVICPGGLILLACQANELPADSVRRLARSFGLNMQNDELTASVDKNNSGRANRRAHERRTSSKSPSQFTFVLLAKLTTTTTRTHVVTSQPAFACQVARRSLELVGPKKDTRSLALLLPRILVVLLLLLDNSRYTRNLQTTNKNKKQKMDLSPARSLSNFEVGFQL